MFLCVRAASAAIKACLNPSAVISIVRNINVLSLVSAPSAHSAPSNFRDTVPGLTNAWLRVLADYFIRTERRDIAVSAIEMRKLIQS